MDDLRATIEAATTASETKTVASTPAVAAPVASAPVASPPPGPAAAPALPSGTPAGTPAPVAGAPASQGTAPAIPAAPKPGEGAQAPASGTPAAPATGQEGTTAPAQASPYDRAPGTWSPEAREAWKDIPQRAREEIVKRDKDAIKALSHSSQARQFQQEFQSAAQPYLGFIAAENSTPMQAMTNMFQTAAMLRVGSPNQKAQIVTDLIKNFGIDLHMLDSMLAGEQTPEAQMETRVQQMVAQQMAPVNQLLQQHRQQAQAQTQTLDSEVDTELAEFAAAHEFYDDVKDMMADIMEMAAKRGHAMGLTTAYERATLLHEPVRRVIDARKAQEQATRNQNIAAQARSAAVGITPSKEAGTTVLTPGDSIRSAIEHAIATKEGR